MSEPFESLGVYWDCDHCHKDAETGLDDEPAGWLVDDGADLALCASCRTFSALAQDPDLERMNVKPRHLRGHTPFGDDPSGWCGCAGCDPRHDCGCSSCRLEPTP